MAKPDWGELQNGDDLVFSESGFTHGDLLRYIISMSEDL